jgi:hypothetical protein
MSKRLRGNCGMERLEELRRKGDGQNKLRSLKYEVQNELVLSRSLHHI